jgi:hypothetical protein
VVTDEELIEGLSFPAYRRVATMVFVPGQSGSSVEMVTIDPLDLQAAQDQDVGTLSMRHEMALSQEEAMNAATILKFKGRGGVLTCTANRSLRDIAKLLKGISS